MYIKARTTPKVVAAFAERREFDKILIYSKHVIATFFCIGIFRHYDRPRIAQLCEKAGLYVRALQSLVDFCGTLSKEWALECMKDLLLVNLRGNLQIIEGLPVDFPKAPYATAPPKGLVIVKISQGSLWAG
ncbi:hypothetical protein V6N11_076950 [Hibiscus sabdariffa]|uniref:Uncharacterized protein n=1 Tax=Hibiscus sabdariffa TaxID=183260 RepID=A0ABR2TC79_9ROSI